MADPKHDPDGTAPFGTTPRRSMSVLMGLIVVFALWFACLLWLALRYPAR